MKTAKGSLVDALFDRLGKTAKGKLALRKADLAATARKALADPSGEALFVVASDTLHLVDFLARRGADPGALEAVHTILLEPVLAHLRAAAERDAASGRRVKRLGAQAKTQQAAWRTGSGGQGGWGNR